MVLKRSAAALAAGAPAAARNKGSLTMPAHQKRATDQGTAQHAAHSNATTCGSKRTSKSSTTRSNKGSSRGSSKGSSRAFTLSVHFTTWNDLEAVLLSWQQSHSEVLVVHVQNELQQCEVQYAVYEFQEEHGAHVQQDVFDQDGSKGVRIIKESACIMAALMALRAHNLPQDIIEHVLDDVQEFWMHAFLDLEDALGYEECPHCGEMRMLEESLVGDMLCCECVEDQAACLEGCCCCCSYPFSDPEYDSEYDS